jgi:hypothetical protein
VRFEAVKGPLRRAFLPVLFGVHSAVAERYGVDSEIHEPRDTTLDYLVAASAGELTGTFGGALEARLIPVGDGYLSETTSEVEKDGMCWSFAVST